MANPTYKGQANVTTKASWFGSWLGASPAYNAAPDTATKVAPTGAAVNPSTNAPVTALANTSTDVPVDTQCLDMRRPIIIVVPREVIEQ
jgi:hypothetical protein